MTTKRCSTCGQHLPHSHFGKHKGRHDGLHGQCLNCRAAYRNANRDKINAQAREYNAKVKEDPARRDLIRSQWRKGRINYRMRHTAKVLALYNKRRAAKLQATPSWLTPEHHADMELCYQEAAALRLYTGQEYHVDHIVPLLGVEVCGLHVPWNLRVILGADNLRKGNQLTADALEY